MSDTTVIDQVPGGEEAQLSGTSNSNVTAPTKLLRTNTETYAYRRFGKRSQYPLLFLQHFTGTLDNWDPAVTDALALDHDVILFDNAGIGRSTGQVSSTIAEMAEHVFLFLDALGMKTCDVLGFSLGGAIAQQMVLDRPGVFRKLVLVGTAPRGGEDVMNLTKPSLAGPLQDSSLHGYQVLQKIFFTSSATSQTAGECFTERLVQRQADREPLPGPEVAQAQLAAFAEWGTYTGQRFSELRQIQQPTLVVNGVNDEMISVRNSYWLSENIPDAVLLTFPDSGHGSLFQWNGPFTRQVKAFLASGAKYAPY